MKTRYWLGASAAALALALGAAHFYSTSYSTLVNEPASGISVEAPQAAKQVAGPGRLEPASEEIRLGSELGGKLRRVEVDEGDVIERGQVLAVLDNDEYAAAVRAAEAQVQLKQASLTKLLRGARQQERQVALAVVHETEAVLANARLELERGHKLFAERLISKEDLQSMERAEQVAVARHEQATERHSLIDSRARPEDRAMAKAELELARAQLEQARALYDKTLIRSPIDGSVLRKHHHPGESVTNSSTIPDPILTIGNQQTVRVRVEIDERDIAWVAVGQKAYVTADAFGQRKFWGRVVQIGQQLGRKQIRTDEPTERADNKVLEVLIELESDAVNQLPMGLRVDAYLLTGEEQAKDAALDSCHAANSVEQLCGGERLGQHAPAPGAGQIVVIRGVSGDQQNR